MHKGPYRPKSGSCYGSIRSDKCALHNEITPVAERLREQLKEMLGRYNALMVRDEKQLKREDEE